MGDTEPVAHCAAIRAGRASGDRVAPLVGARDSNPASFLPRSEPRSDQMPRMRG